MMHHNNNRRNIIIGTIAVGVFLVASFLFVTHHTLAPSASGGERTYHGHGISFTYPSTYMVREHVVESTLRYHYSIVLIEDNQNNRDLLSGAIVGEGPPAITFDVFQNNLDKESVVGFVVGNSNSNFKLSDGTYKETTATRSRVPALSYSWDGLYRGDSVVFLDEARMNIMMASVTYLAPEDALRADFKKILGSVAFDAVASE